MEIEELNERYRVEYRNIMTKSIHTINQKQIDALDAWHTAMLEEMIREIEGGVCERQNKHTTIGL